MVTVLVTKGDKHKSKVTVDWKTISVRNKFMKILGLDINNLKSETIF